MWKSPSTPAEVVDPLRQQAINLSRYVWADYIWADLMKSVRYGEKAQETDARGWPTTTGIELVIGERYYGSDPEMSGAYLFRFEGQAEVRQECCGQPVFQANGRRFQWNLPRGVGYEASTNSTTTLMTLSGSRTMLTFNDAQRAPGGGGAGVAQIQPMRPLAQGSSKHHRADEIVYRPFKQVAEEHFTVLRFVASADHVGESWSQRTLPDYAFFRGTRATELGVRHHARQRDGAGPVHHDPNRIERRVLGEARALDAPRFRRPRALQEANPRSDLSTAKSQSSALCRDGQRDLELGL